MEHDKIIVYFYICLVEGVYCSNDDERYLSCNHCPGANDSVSHAWCGGNCIFDVTRQVCREGNF